MSFTRNGKLRFATSDPVCAIQILSLDQLFNISVNASVIWEGITSRFLLYEIPTNVSLEELSAELQDSNNFEIVEIRRFIKSGINPEISPVLITILGTVLPDNVKLWFINHKIQLFIDKPRQCTKCFSFSHPSRFCQSPAICCNCGSSHSGEYTVNANCIYKLYITQPQIIQGNIFADFFASKNAYHEPIPLDFFHKEDNNLNKPFHIFEIHRAIKLSKNSTPGADHITAYFLKNLDRNGCEIILRYFQDLFDNAIVPNSWKHAVILPIPKPCKDKTRISSYRPIALTFIFSKTFESVLTNRLSYFLTTERKLHPQHYGFVPFKDSRSATYLIHKAIMDAKLKKKYFVGVSLDIKNAYDSDYVDGLYKCLQIGITGKTAIWIHKFLTYRSFQIKWRGYLSSIRIFPQGLPQGSVLSPILYTIYTYDFFETNENDIECSVYADDVFLYCSHHSLGYICKKMQNTLDRISQWCKYWKLSLSPDKRNDVIQHIIELEQFFAPSVVFGNDYKHARSANIDSIRRERRPREVETPFWISPRHSAAENSVLSPRDEIRVDTLSYKGQSTHLRVLRRRRRVRLRCRTFAPWGTISESRTASYRPPTPLNLGGNQPHLLRIQ
ncbi:probable RNA-directed DNA polymerase from transposon BS [Trichonephila clavipes]|uniref:Probable RNA-directed DNA polymerase from transposon BS n=1 Tax=Trichonephila clavipes TaxID=2585209 RepID=A0A8X6W6L4_TRICX|nr:probable RNA-directed DNA polymerase from transposon BS [Trichonephila clavipes]